jgi:hypothetical protein
MSATDKNAMVRNTVLSYLHELYFRITTGLPLSERELYVQDPDEQDRPAPFVTRAILQNTINQVFKLPSPPSQSNTFTLNYASLSPSKVLSYASLTRAQKTSGGTGDTKVSKAFTSTAVKSVTSIHYLGKRKAKAQATADIGAQASKKKTVYIDREVAGKYMMSPKLFERVFFVDVDPDDFEIDREETFKSEVGRSTFAQLQQAKEIEVESETLGRQTRDSYYLKDHRLEKQMTFEKYFVVVRAYTRGHDEFFQAVPRSPCDRRPGRRQLRSQVRLQLPRPRRGSGGRGRRDPQPPEQAWRVLRREGHRLPRLGARASLRRPDLEAGDVP